MAMKMQVLLCLVTFLVQFACASYKYSSWSVLPRCAQNCLSRVVSEGSTDPSWGCDGKNITCACYGHPRNSDVAPSFWFDFVYDRCITDDPWIPKNSTGGCKNHPTNQDVDIDELKKYENDIFCFLNNATCSHDGCQSPQSSSSTSSTSSRHSTSSTSTTSSSSSSTSSTSSSVASSQSASSSAARTSSAASTSSTATNSTASTSAQSVQLTTVGVVVTASIQADASTSTDPATTTTVQAQSSKAGTSYGGLSDMAMLKSTIALLMVVAGMMILAG